jgi:uncharacterized OB-fold protein
MRLQHCTMCSTAQYPPRELCAVCLADTLEVRETDAEPGEVLAVTLLHHSHDPAFSSRLPICIGLVRLDAGPSAVCFLAGDCEAGMRVSVVSQQDHAGRIVLSASPVADRVAASDTEAS